MSPLDLLQAFRRAGVAVVLAEGRLWLKGRQAPPPELVERLRVQRLEVANLLAQAARRVPEFAEQAGKPGGVPFLTLARVEAGPDRCLSCGEGLAGGVWRCPPCAEAAWQVLQFSADDGSARSAEKHVEEVTGP